MSQNSLEYAKVYTKNDMNNILFSGQKKKIMKVDKVIFCVVSIYTFAILLLMLFVFNDVMSQVFFGLGIFFMNAFIYTGYKWMSQSPFYVKKEWKWFVATCILGCIMPLFKFTSGITSEGYSSIAFMPISYLICLLAREFYQLSKTKLSSNTKPLFRYAPLMLKIWTGITLFVSYFFIGGFIAIGQGSIALIAIVIIIGIAFVVLNLIASRKINTKLFLGGIGSIVIIPLSTLVGVFAWAIVVFAVKFQFGAVSFGSAAVQVILLIVGTYILLRGKNEFQIPFVKSFVSSLFLLFIGAIGIGGKTLDANGDGSFINSLIFVASTVVFYIIMYKKDVKRSLKYVLIEGLTINVLVFTMLGIAIMQSMGTLNLSQDVDVQTILTGLCLIPLFLNSIISSIDWIKTLKFKEKEITWK